MLYAWPVLSVGCCMLLSWLSDTFHFCSSIKHIANDKRTSGLFLNEISTPPTLTLPLPLWLCLSLSAFVLCTYFVKRHSVRLSPVLCMCLSHVYIFITTVFNEPLLYKSTCIYIYLVLFFFAFVSSQHAYHGIIHFASLIISSIWRIFSLFMALCVRPSPSSGGKIRF